MTYQEANRVLLDDMTTTGEPMTIEATIAAHTEGASDAQVQLIAAPRAGHKADLDRREIEVDVDRAIARTYSKGGGVARWGAPR